MNHHEDARALRRSGWTAGLVAVTLLMGVQAIAGGSAQARPAEQVAQSVSIVDFAFSPATLAVPVGTRVTWTNTGQAPHTTTADNGAWDSNPLNSGQSFSFTFSNPGTFTYHCKIHPTMTASIIVQAAAAAPAPAAQAQPTAAAARSPAPAPAADPAAPAAPAMPRTGASSASEGGAPLWRALAVLGGVVLAGGTAGGLALARRRR